MASFKERLKSWSKDDLIRESKHILNKDPSSYNWTPASRQAILDELNKRKVKGTVSMRAGVTKKYKERANLEMGFPVFKW